MAAGDRLKFRFCGAVVDWWNWGRRQENYTEAHVYLPHFTMGPVLQTPLSSTMKSDVCP